MAWQPLKRLDTGPGWVWNPDYAEQRAKYDLPKEDEVWGNDRYQVRVYYQSTGGVKQGRADLIQLSINAWDRGPMRNWRHLQQIKNEVAGEDRTAVEVFPPEDHLVDTSNQYHLWVFPEGFVLPFGFRERYVSNDEDVERFNDEPHKGRQTPWEPGITTGRRPDDPSMFEKGPK